MTALTMALLVGQGLYNVVNATNIYNVQTQESGNTYIDYMYNGHTYMFDVPATYEEARHLEWLYITNQLAKDEPYYRLMQINVALTKH